MSTVYMLCDPRTSAPFYIGSTNRPLKSRIGEHLTSGRIRTVVELQSLGLAPVSVALFDVPPLAQFQVEYIVTELASRSWKLDQCIVPANLKKMALKAQYFIDRPSGPRSNAKWM